MQVCKGRCDLFEKYKHFGRVGTKKCKICEMLYETTEIYCACCNGRLSARPRTMCVKLRLLKRLGKEMKRY
jgi:hypothetical protein